MTPLRYEEPVYAKRRRRRLRHPDPEAVDCWPSASFFNLLR